MKSVKSPKDRPRESLFVRVCLIGGLMCCVVGLVFWFSDSGGVYNASGQKTRSQSASWFGLGGPARRTIRKSVVEDTFGTIFHSELMGIFKLHSWQQEGEAKLTSTLQAMERTGVKTVIYSFSWDFIAPDEGTLKMAYINNLTEVACSATGMQVGFIVDMLRSPGWLFRKFPDAKAMDSGKRNYTHMSWFHNAANAVALDMLRKVSEHLVKNYNDCVVSIQPVYNNEYEAKYTQEYDSYQDYNAHALEAYRDWLRNKKRDVASLNRRWGTTFRSWQELLPPGVMAGMLMGVEDGARYWDWIRFREEHGAYIFNRACGVVKAAGLKCFHHFPEFFSVLDAMYGATMFTHIAASENTDFIIMDSNFMTPYRTVMNPVKLRLYISAARVYGKPVYFEAAVERFADLELIQAGYKNALLAGASNLGITNWLNRVEMNSSLHDAFYNAPQGALACTAKELVGVFVHLASCTAFQGLQWHWKDKDPLHNFIEDIAERLTVDCGSDIAVYIELDRFLADMPTLSRAVFVEPLVLYGKELSAYVAAKAALVAIPHEILNLPTNSSRGLQLKVLQDL